jgi:hypothetical protein
MEFLEYREQRNRSSLEKLTSFKSVMTDTFCIRCVVLLMWLPGQKRSVMICFYCFVLLSLKSMPLSNSLPYTVTPLGKFLLLRNSCLPRMSHIVFRSRLATELIYKLHSYSHSPCVVQMDFLHSTMLSDSSFLWDCLAGVIGKVWVIHLLEHTFYRYAY